MERPSIFITGAAAGIGRATARQFGSRGWFVGVYDMNAAGVESLGQELGAGNCTGELLDVTDAVALAGALPYLRPQIHWYAGFQTWLLAIATCLLPTWLTRLTSRRVWGY